MKPAHTHYECLQGRRVLISGGTTGIGRAIALRLSAEGAKVLIFGRNAQHLEDALADIRKNDRKALGTVADVSKNEDLRRVFEMVDQEWGGLDVLIANAAIGAEGVQDVADDDLDYAIMTNISGYLKCCRYALSRMKENAHIVMVGSISADIKYPGGSIYVATKGAIQAFAESFRQEAGEQGIKVTLIEPGKTGSDMIDESPEEQRESIAKLEMLKAEDVAVSVEYVLTQPKRCNISDLKIVPTKSKHE